MNRTLIDRLFVPRPSRAPEPIPSGLYHYMREHDGLYTRFHLRVEPDGAGMLIANATAAARLSPAGVVIAKGLMDGSGEGAILRELGQRFRGATPDQHRADLVRVQTLLRGLETPGDMYPIINLEDAAVSPHESQLMAPLEADIPLAEPGKLVPILDRLWEIGIPHIAILVPDDLNRSSNPNPAHLVRAVERAEDLGLICGVSGRASDLAGGSLIDDLAMAGVDHVTAFYASSNPEIHDALFGEGDHEAVARVFARTQELEVADVGHIPLVQDTVNTLEDTLEALLALEVPNAAFFAIATTDEEGDGAIPAEAMRQIAAQVEEDAGDAQVRYLWEPPVKRNPNLTLIEQVRAGPRCAGDVAVRIEPDGSVIPPRGPFKAAGNLLRDSWETIWGRDVFRIYRERVETPTRCDVCPGLAICAADCPREPEGWAFGRYSRGIALFVVFLLLVLFTTPVSAQSYAFSVETMQMEVFVQPDASVRIEYDITFNNGASAHAIDIVDIGTPHKDYDTGNMVATIDGVVVTDIR
ncbi:MAG: hypothetical protein ACE5GO_12070, partial [Anaerolineales bacterium]